MSFVVECGRLAKRSSISADLQVHADDRRPEPVEVSAYYVVAEARTNAAKHARASAITIKVDTDAAVGVLHVTISDNGVGGGLTGGTGLLGLKGRVEALGGRIFLDSQAGAGTTPVRRTPAHRRQLRWN